MKNFTPFRLLALSALFLGFTQLLSAQELCTQTRIHYINTSKGDGLTYAEGSSRYEYSSYSTVSNYSYSGDPCRIFIGVFTEPAEQGIRVSSVIKDTPAKLSGVQEGDIILNIDNVAVNSQSDLIRQRDTHKQGDAFTLAILREGKAMTINARFKSCTEEEQQKVKENELVKLNDLDARLEEMKTRLEEMKTLRAGNDFKFDNFGSFESIERPILGIYPDENADVKGIAISDIVNGKGASAAGLKSGDVIIMVDGKDMTESSIAAALKGHKVGDAVKVVYVRAGNTNETNVILSPGQNVFTYRFDRDPCAVFIGVYTGGHNEQGQGVTVTGIIDNTPAKTFGVEPGDVILALDGQSVNTHGELGRERDKHKAGEKFNLTVLRGGQTLTINAQFKSCDEKTETPKEEVVTIQEKPASPESKEGASVKDLKLAVFNAYPNPTFGPLNVQFEAEAIPTTVRVFDMSGKAVFTQTLNSFGGMYNEQINLSGKTPGNYVLSIEQGGKTFAKTVVLMPRV